MSTYSKRYSLSAIALVVLAGCGGSDEGLSDLGINTTAPLVCQSPEVVNEAGNGCEVPVSNCPLPLTDGEIPGTCQEFTGAWPEDGNGLNMPEPVYTAAAGDVQGFSEVVYYFNHKDFATIGSDGWGLHAWNGSGTLCQAYADYDVPDGGTDWGVPQAPVGEDPNYGIYFIMPLRDAPICGNMIPYNFNDGKQADVDIQIDMSSIETGNYFVLARNTEDRYDPGTVFPYPRTYAAIESLPDGFEPEPEPLACEFPEVANEDETACLPPQELEPFVPGEVTLYLRGGFNDWGNDADGNFALNDAVAFHYADGLYTTTLSLPANAEGYDFKIADESWAENSSFGGPQGGVDEREVPLDESRVLISGRTADDQDIEGNMRLTLEEDTNLQFTVNATDPEKLSLSITKVPLAVPLYVRGSMNNFGADEEGNFSLASGTRILRYQGNNIYSTQLPLTQSEEGASYEFKIADPGNTAETNFGAMSGEEMLVLNEAKILQSGEEATNIQYRAEVDETVTLSLDVTDMAAPVLTASKVPYGTTAIYVRGGMNDWGNDADGNFKLTAQDAFEYLGEGVYQSTLALDETTHFFKIADADWATVNFGDAPGEDGAVVLNEAKTLTSGSESANLALEITAAANYVFNLDASVPAAPELTIRNQEAFVGTPVFIRGSINDWGTGNEMTYMGEGIYQTTITLGTSTAEEPHVFKVASEDWAAANYGGSPAEGADNNVVVNEDKMLTPGDDSANLPLVIETEGDYIFSLDTKNLANPTINVFSADLYNAEAVYLRGSMNDWGTGNAMTAAGNAQYSLDIELAADSYAFKVASEDWAAVNIGAPVTEGSSPVVTIGEAKMLSSGEAEAANIEMTVETDGMYRFKVWHISPLRPVLEVNPVE